MTAASSTFIFGKHAVLGVLKNPNRALITLYLTEKNAQQWDKAWGDLDRLPHRILSMKDIDHILKEDKVHQGFVAQVGPIRVPSFEVFLEHLPDAGIVVVLDQVTDPHNVGAILRSAAAFGALAVITTERHSAGCEGVVAKTASGALEHVPLLEVGNVRETLTSLKEHQFWVYGFDEGGRETVNHVAFSGRVALVFGAEGKGLRRLTKENSDVLVALPTCGAFSTLNVSTSVAVALYEVARQLKTI